MVFSVFSIFFLFSSAVAQESLNVCQKYIEDHGDEYLTIRMFEMSPGNYDPRKLHFAGHIGHYLEDGSNHWMGGKDLFDFEVEGGAGGWVGDQYKQEKHSKILKNGENYIIDPNHRVDFYRHYLLKQASIPNVSFKMITDGQLCACKVDNRKLVCMPELSPASSNQETVSKSAAISDTLTSLPGDSILVNEVESKPLEGAQPTMQRDSIPSNEPFETELAFQAKPNLCEYVLDHVVDGFMVEEAEVGYKPYLHKKQSMEFSKFDDPSISALILIEHLDFHGQKLQYLPYYRSLAYRMFPWIKALEFHFYYQGLWCECSKEKRVEKIQCLDPLGN